jgi:predicted DNA-binding transcriptional regulator AlpA
MQKEIILSLPQVQQRTGLTRNQITEKINNGTFPKPFKRNIWLKSHIDNWLQNQSNQPPDDWIQKLETIFRRILLLLQIAMFVYSHIKSEIMDIDL